MISTCKALIQNAAISRDLLHYHHMHHTSYWLRLTQKLSQSLTQAATIVFICSYVITNSAGNRSKSWPALGPSICCCAPLLLTHGLFSTSRPNHPAPVIQGFQLMASTSCTSLSLIYSTTRYFELPQGLLRCLKESEPNLILGRAHL